MTDNQRILDQLASQRFDAPVTRALRDAMRALGSLSADEAALDPANQPGFDAQSRGAFSLCKALKISPAQAAENLSAELGARLAGIGTCATSSGAGFVNIRLDDAWIESRLAQIPGVFPDASGLRALIDYSSPNCAKRMHVGHLRSTVIGDALRRMLRACGADVEIVNHLGDWGTPFGIIIEQARDEGAHLSAIDLEALEGVYQRGQARYKGKELESLAFAQRAREATSAMQARSGAPYEAWRAIRERTVAELQKTYELLDVGLRPEHAIGESAYQEAAPSVLADLVSRGVAVSGPQGVAFLGGKTPLPLEKSAEAGGGLLYGGTDATALRQRAQTGRWLLYVTDERQADHFASLFELGRQAGWTQSGQARHVPFGMMLSSSGQPFKSRSGGVMPLTELVEEAIDSARREILKRVPGAPPEEIDLFARPIGVGALKYGDLSRSRVSAIKFDPALAARMEGDTGPYLQYARSRAVSAIARAQRLPDAERAPGLAPQERELALALGRLRDASVSAVQTLEPHKLCKSLYEAASAFSSFYEHCPCVQKAPLDGRGADGQAMLDDKRDPWRLALIERFARDMESSMLALGIEPLDSMPRAPAPARAPSP